MNKCPNETNDCPSSQHTSSGIVTVKDADGPRRQARNTNNQSKNLPKATLALLRIHDNHFKFYTMLELILGHFHDPIGPIWNVQIILFDIRRQRQRALVADFAPDYQTAYSAHQQLSLVFILGQILQNIFGQRADIKLQPMDFQQVILGTRFTSIFLIGHAALTQL